MDEFYDPYEAAWEEEFWANQEAEAENLELPGW